MAGVLLGFAGFVFFMSLLQSYSELSCYILRCAQQRCGHLPATPGEAIKLHLGILQRQLQRLGAAEPPQREPHSTLIVLDRPHGLAAVRPRWFELTDHARLKVEQGMAAAGPPSPLRSKGGTTTRTTTQGFLRVSERAKNRDTNTTTH
jgi:hypothetical protein